jgi:MSHA biogenesis protein MshO
MNSKVPKLKVQNSQGFTLLELIMVIVIVGIMATITTDIITLPVKSYIDLERRTTLVDSAEMSLRRMQRDIRRALPNSIRITGGTVIELLHTTDGGRYRGKLASDGSGDILDFTVADSGFDVIGTLNTAPSGELVVYNLGSTSADAYAGNNRETIANTSTVSTIDLNPVPTNPFPFQSPQQRFFIVDTPISYSCVNGELRRYDNTIDSSYSISSSSPNLATLSYKVQAKADTITCSFSYAAGTATRGGLVTLEIILTDQAGESAKLIHQVHVDNMP